MGFHAWVLTLWIACRRLEAEMAKLGGILWLGFSFACKKEKAA